MSKCWMLGWDSCSEGGRRITRLPHTLIPLIELSKLTVAIPACIRQSSCASAFLFLLDLIKFHTFLALDIIWWLSWNCHRFVIQQSLRSFRILTFIPIPVFSPICLQLQVRLPRCCKRFILVGIHSGMWGVWQFDWSYWSGILWCYSIRQLSLYHTWEVCIFVVPWRTFDTFDTFYVGELLCNLFIMSMSSCSLFLVDASYRIWVLDICVPQWSLWAESSSVCRRSSLH